MGIGSLGSLVVSLGLDAADYVQGLTRAEYQARQFKEKLEVGLGLDGSAILGVGAAAVATGLLVAKMGHDFLTAAANLDDMAEKTGASVEELSKLQQTAYISGTSLELVETGMVKLAAALNETDEGAKKGQRALAALGLNMADLKKDDTAVALRKVAIELSKYADSGAKAALIRDLLGRGGAQLLSFLKDMIEDEQHLATVTTAEAAEAEKLEKNWRGLILQGKVLAGRLAIDMLPAMNDWLKAVSAAIKDSGLLMGVWVALGGVAANIFGQTDKDIATKRLKEVDEAIRAARLRLEYGTTNPAGSNAASPSGFLTNLFVPDIKVGEEQLKKLRANITQLEAERKHLLSVITPTAPTTASDKKALDYGELLDAKAAASALQNLLDQRAKIELDSQKDLAQARTQILDEMHRDNLIGEKDFWSIRLGIQKDALDAELKALDAQITRQQEQVSKTKKGSKEYYDAQKDLEASLAKRNKLEEDFSNTATVSYLQAKRAAEAYKTAVHNIDIEVQSLLGNEAEAARLRLEEQNKNLRAQMTANNDTAGLARLSQLEELSGYQRRFNELKQQEGEITARLALEEERIQNSRRVGATDELESLYQTGEARKQAANQLEGIVAEEEKLSRLWKNPGAVLQADQARVALQKLRAESELLSEKFKTIFTDSFADAFASFVNGTRTASEAFKDFAKSVLTEIARIAAAKLAATLYSASGLGSIFGTIATAIAGTAAGGGASIPASSEYSLSYGMSSGQGLKFPAYADGTDYVPRTGLALLHQGEKVLGAGESWSGGAVASAINFNFSFAGGSPTDPQTFLSTVIPVMRNVARTEILYQQRPGGVLA